MGSILIYIAIMTILVVRYSSIPYLLPSLPNPLCFTPPNGATGSDMAPKIREKKIVSFLKDKYKIGGFFLQNISHQC